MSTIRVLFAGTPEFALSSLEQIISDEHFEIVGVLTQPDRPAGRNLKLQPSPVKMLAEKYGLRVWSPDKASDPIFLEELKRAGPETGVVVAYGQILSQDFLNLFPLGCVNVHASILPRWRGAAPIQRSLMAGDTRTGVTLQVIRQQLDAGEVLGAREFAISDDMDALTVHDKMRELSRELLHVEFMDYLRGNLGGREQDESQVTYAKKIRKDETQIQWQQSVRGVFNHIRGLVMGPSAWTTHQTEKLKIFKARPVDGKSHKSQSGKILAVEADSIRVACSDGALDIFEVQPESRKRQTVREYLQGRTVKVGDSFGS